MAQVWQGNYRAPGHQNDRPAVDAPKTVTQSRITSNHRQLADAIHRLRRHHPEQSAGQPIWKWQAATGSVLVGAAIGQFVIDFATGYHLVSATAIILFTIIVIQRIFILVAAIMPPPWSGPRRKARMPEDQLPDYSVLVPLYREAAILPDLVQALAAIDYPSSRLEIIIILEASDTPTLDTAARIELPPTMRVVVVPDRQPRTKPKALNYALAVARGRYIAVYDAEDIPDPQQLRKAAAAFATSDPPVHCVQARLGIYNQRQGWFTRQFSLEYMALFRCLLPALVRLNIPIPLGGTSNHFRRQVLDELCGWDPFNVTEDADLGIRLARAGYRIGLIDSDTMEEAPASWRHWLPQRTRWIKGWMQTYLVHCRRPLELVRDLGLWRALGFHALIGGFLLSVLLHPFFYIMVAMELAQPTPFAAAESTTGRLMIVAAVFNVFGGFTAALLMMCLGALRAGRVRLIGHVIWAPLYWLMISVAAYRALIQLFARPHYWEKTPHHAREAPNTASGLANQR